MSRAPMDRPYDFAPVDAALNRRLEPVVAEDTFDRARIVWATDQRKAEFLGTFREQVTRWRRDGLTEVEADWCATRLGTHPALLWGQDFWREGGLTVLDDEFVNHGGWRPGWLYAEESA